MPLSDNLIKSASRTVKSRGRFFDRSDSDKVRSVYDYFAIYQARLAVLLTEYFHAKPDVYSPQTVKAEVDNLQARVNAQAQSLKPAVPEGTVIDTRTSWMWTQRAVRRSLYDLAYITKLSPTPQAGVFQWRPEAVLHAKLDGLPFTDWGLPSWEYLQGLISGWSGESPLAWLRKEAHFGPQDSPLFLLAQDVGYRYGRVPNHNSAFRFKVSLHKYDLRANTWDFSIVAWSGPAPDDVSGYPVAAKAVQPFKEHVRSAIYFRITHPNERYWWD